MGRPYFKSRLIKYLWNFKLIKKHCIKVDLLKLKKTYMKLEVKMTKNGTKLKNFFNLLKMTRNLNQNLVIKP